MIVPRHRPHVLATGFCLLLACAACASGSTSQPDADAGFFPFVLPWDDASPGITSVAAWNDVPAGAGGFVYAADGRLYVKDPQAADGRRRIRFLGVNTAFAANFPSPAEAEKTAARLAKFGINCVRLHHMDRDAAPKGLWQPDLRTFDAGQLDRLDYFVSRLKAHGIYVNLNLHVSRVYPGMPVWEGMPSFHKGVDLFMPEMIELQKVFARDLLGHVNPYTGLAYRDDPAVAFVEINNENGLVSRWWEKWLDAMPEPYAAELGRLWRTWRRGRHLPPDGDAIILRRDYDAQGEARRREWIEFLWETERGYWREMRRFLVEDLAVRSLIVGTQLYSYSALPLQTDMDVIDIHAYWQHPEYPQRADRNIWTVGNESMVNHPEARTISDLALQRVAGKPLIVTEYNHSAPNTYGAETFLMVAAYAALQDWDAVFAYSYAHGNQPWAAGKINGNYDIYSHSVKMVTLPVAAALFRRGDVAVPPMRQVVTATDAQFLALTVRHGVNIGGQHFGASRQDALRRPQALRLGAPAPVLTEPPLPRYAGKITSDGGELAWDARAPRGRFDINTPRTKAVAGFSDGQRIELGALVVRPGRTRQGWSAIACTQMEGEAIGSSGRALLVACGEVRNSGQLWRNAERNSLASWGGAPVETEGIPAEIELQTQAPVAVWALDESGQRRAEVPVRRQADTVQFSIGPDYRTLWYEIVVGPAH